MQRLKNSCGLDTEQKHLLIMCNSVQKLSFCELSTPAVCHLLCSALLYQWFQLCPVGFLVLYSLPCYDFESSFFYLPFLFKFLFYSTVCSRSWERKDYPFQKRPALDEYQQALVMISILLSADPFLPALLMLLAGFFPRCACGDGECEPTASLPGVPPAPRPPAEPEQVPPGGGIFIALLQDLPWVPGTRWGIPSCPFPNLIAHLHRLS